MDDCIFCKIANKEIPSQIVYEDDKVIAFKDINPVAPVHYLVIPKKHLANVLEIDENNFDLIGHIQIVINKLAKEANIADSGFRVVTNCNKDSGQVVFHLHYHLIGGEELKNFA